MKRPPKADAERCIELRKQSKRGQRLHPDDSAFCTRMYNQFPEWYNETEARVFDETVPFGSNAKYRRPRNADIVAILTAIAAFFEKDENLD